MERCLEAGSSERLALPGLKSERRAVIAGGLSILYTLATHFGIAELKPARGALRQGVIFDLAARQAAERRAGGEDLREASVRELQRRFQVDVAQAERVARIAAALLRSASPDTGREAARELAWAAALHEAGMMISHHDHHRHSAYLLGHVDAPGFSQSQLRRIGELVLGQRGGLRKMETSLQKHGLRAAPALLAPGGDRLPRPRRRRSLGDRAPQRGRRAGGHARAVVGRVASARAAPAARRDRRLGQDRRARTATRCRLIAAAAGAAARGCPATAPRAGRCRRRRCAADGAATTPRPSSSPRVAVRQRGARRRPCRASADGRRPAPARLASGQPAIATSSSALAPGPIATAVRNLRPSAFAVCWQRSAGLTSTRVECVRRWFSHSAMRSAWRSPLLVSERFRSSSPESASSASAWRQRMRSTLLAPSARTGPSAISAPSGRRRSSARKCRRCAATRRPWCRADTAPGIRR